MFQIFHEIYVLLRLLGIHFFSLFGRAGAAVLIEGIGETDERIVKLAEHKLKNMGTRAVPALLEAVKSKSLLKQNRAASLLGKMGSDAVLPLSLAMKNEDSFVRLEAISSLGLLGQEVESAIPHLINALIDPSVKIRKISKKALWDIRGRGQRALLNALKPAIKSDKYHAYKIAETLAGFGEDALPDLIEILMAGDKALQPYAMHAIRFIGKAALPTVIDLLKHKESRLRSSAAKICEMMIHRAKEAVPALTDALTDEDDDVRFRAAMALGIIGGDPSRFVPVLKELTISLNKYEGYELYHDNHKRYRVHIPAQYPIVGEVGWDRLGQGFLAPEEDERGGGMRSIQLVGNFFRSGEGTTGDLTRVSGFYEKGVGLLVTNMVPEEDTPDRVY